MSNYAQTWEMRQVELYAEQLATDYETAFLFPLCDVIAENCV